MTTLEADYERIHPIRFKWVLSRVDVHDVHDVHDVTKEVTDQAATLLRAHHLHSHKHAIDGAFAVIARNAPRPVTVLTSDPEDLTLLCGPSVEVVKV
nr:hypothetical protein [Streptomyces sp. ICN441]